MEKLRVSQSVHGGVWQCAIWDSVLQRLWVNGLMVARGAARRGGLQQQNM